MTFDKIYNNAMKLYETIGGTQTPQQQLDPKTGKPVQPAANPPTGTPSVAGAGQQTNNPVPANAQQPQGATQAAPQAPVPGKPIPPVAPAANTNPAGAQNTAAPLTPEQQKAIQAGIQQISTYTPEQLNAHLDGIQKLQQQQQQQQKQQPR